MVGHSALLLMSAIRSCSYFWSLVSLLLDNTQKCGAQRLMLSTRLSCQAQSLLQIEYDCRQVAFLTRMFYEMKYFLISLCSWKGMSKFIMCYFPGCIQAAPKLYKVFYVEVLLMPSQMSSQSKETLENKDSAYRKIN